MPDGDKRLQSLNYVNADKADDYQLKDKGENKDGKEARVENKRNKKAS